MTTDNKQSVLTNDEIDAIQSAHNVAFHAGVVGPRDFARTIEQAVLSKLRGAGEPSDETLTAVYDVFGIGILARTPSALMTCLSNAVRRSRCLSQVERVLSVPTPPEPEDDGVWGEKSLLLWGAEPETYADHFKDALATFSSRGAPPASAEVRNAALEDAAKLLDGRADLYNSTNDSARTARCWAEAIRDLKSAPVAEPETMEEILRHERDRLPVVLPKDPTLPEGSAKGAGDAREPSPTAGMNIAQRILHVGGRNNAQGYVEFGSIQAVEALVRQVLRDLPSDRQQRGGDVSSLREALRWTAACLLAYTDGSEGESFRMTETGETKLISEVLDMADAALAPPEQIN